MQIRCIKIHLNADVFSTNEDIADPDKETPEDVNSKAKNSEADNDISLAKQLIKEAKTEQDLIKIWSDFSAYHTEIKCCCQQKKNLLGI